jgi:hypothetical protein
MDGNVREVVGVFPSVGALEAAADELMGYGFDRARLSLIATDEVVAEHFGGRMKPVKDLEDDPSTPRIAYVDRDTLAIGEGAAIGGLFYLGVMAGAGAVLVSGGTLLPALFAAAAGGAGGAGLGAVLAGRLGAETADKISDEVQRGGLILWVRTGGEGEDEKASAIMAKHGAKDVHAHGEG